MEAGSTLNQICGKMGGESKYEWPGKMDFSNGIITTTKTRQLFNCLLADKYPFRTDSLFFIKWDFFQYCQSFYIVCCISKMGGMVTKQE